MPLKIFDFAIGVIDDIALKEQVRAGLQKSNQIMDKVDAIMQDKQKYEVTLP